MLYIRDYTLAFLLTLFTLAVAPIHAQDAPPVPTPSYPADGLTVPTNVPELNWWVGAPIGSMTFDVQVEIAASEAGTCNTAGWPTGIVGLQFATVGCDPLLLPGETYRWRVRSVDGGVESAWSDWAVFTTDGPGLAVPSIPSYPIGGLEVYTTQLQLHWYTTENNNGISFVAWYLQRTAGAPASCEAIRNDLSAQSAPVTVGITHASVSGLTPGVTYDWCVRSTGLNGSFDSDLASFVTSGPGTAVAATPSYPVDGLEIYTTSPQLSWYTGENNTGVNFTAYYLKRAAAPPADCAAIRLDGSSGSATPPPGATQVAVSNLELGSTYDWCVRSSGLNGDFDSPVASFETTGAGIAGAPVASWPVGNPTVYQTDQYLHWYMDGMSADWTGFEVEYCVAPNVFGDPGCVTVPAIMETQIPAGAFNYGDVVTWRVRATYASGPPSDWNNVNSQGSFTVVGALSTLFAVPTYPTDDLLVYDTGMTFSWFVAGGVGAANAFKVQYSQDETFPQEGGATFEVESDIEIVDITGLVPGASYWWRVAVSIDGGETFGTWSDAASFAVYAGASAPMPRIGGPTNGIGVSTASPTLSWLVPAPSTSEIVYDLRYSKDGTFDSGNETEITGLAAPFVQVEGLEEGSYQWQVRSRTVDGSSTSAYSEVGRFSTSFRFNVNTEDGSDLQLPVAFELGQNYPNPFNPSTTIEYRMSETAVVTIKVYNALGQVVKTLVDGVVPAGVHQVVWDATDNAGASVATGVYLYRMDVAGSTVTRALVLMK